MRFQRRGSPDRTLMFDLTAMIDCVFLLNIFFLTTAQFSRMTRADLDLPLQPGEQHVNPDEPGVVVNVQRDGTIIVDDEVVTPDELRSIIETEVSLHDGRADRVKLLLRVDRELRSERLNELVTLLQEMGVGLGRFATEVPR
jgi:biopolymer transport protein ExbD